MRGRRLRSTAAVRDGSWVPPLVLVGDRTPLDAETRLHDLSSAKQSRLFVVKLSIVSATDETIVPALTQTTFRALSRSRRRPCHRAGRRRTAGACRAPRPS